MLLNKCASFKYGHEVAKELIQHHRAWDREYINKRCPDLSVYSIGEKVSARQAVRSDERRFLVGKLTD